MSHSMALEVEQIETTLKKLNGEIFGLETEIAGKGALENERTRLIKEKTDLDAQKPQAASPEEQKEQEHLHALREKKAIIESSIEANRVKISLIEEFCTRAKILKVEVKEFNTEIKKHLPSWGWVLESNGADFIFTEPTRIDELLKGKILEIEESIKKLEGLKTETIAPLPSSDVAADTLVSIERQIADLEAKSKLEVQRKRKLMEFSKRVSEITARIAMIDKTIAALNTTKVQLPSKNVLASARSRSGTSLQSWMLRRLFVQQPQRQRLLLSQSSAHGRFCISLKPHAPANRCIQKTVEFIG